MTDSTTPTDELRDIDQIGYDNYRYLLDLIYDKGSKHEDHYKLKNQVDRYIEGLLADRDRRLIQEIKGLKLQSGEASRPDEYWLVYGNNKAIDACIAMIEKGSSK